MTVRILVIDDELARLQYKRDEFLERWNLFPESPFSRRVEYTFISSQHVRPDRIENDASLAVAHVAQDPDAWSLVLLDMQFDHGELVKGEPKFADPQFGLKIQAALANEFPDLPIVQFTAQMHIDIADEDGHYLSKIDGKLEDLHTQLIERGRVSLEDKRLLLRIPADTIVASEATIRVYGNVYRSAHSNVPLLIRGESGTGKEYLARYLHLMSPNASEPWVAFQVSAIQAPLYESTLFGHEKGSFTGADKFSPGLFSEAGAGTIFLDEIGALPQELQVKLLRVIGERKYRRVGGTADQEVRCRVVAATKDNLESNASRDDLWARFDTVVVPPLRDRPEEVAPLAAHFLAVFQKERGKKGMKFSPRALNVLSQQPFVENARGLAKAIRPAVIKLSSNSVIQPRDLKLDQSVHSPHEASEMVERELQGAPAVPTTISARGSIERIALQDLLVSMQRTVAPDDDLALRGALTEFDLKCSRIRQELIMAALYCCRSKYSGRLNVLASMQLLTDDPILASKATRDLKSAFGLVGKGGFDRNWLQRLMNQWLERRQESDTP